MKPLRTGIDNDRTAAIAASASISGIEAIASYIGAASWIWRGAGVEDAVNPIDTASRAVIVLECSMRKNRLYPLDYERSRRSRANLHNLGQTWGLCQVVRKDPPEDNCLPQRLEVLG
jgi:hypothetical protein